MSLQRITEKKAFHIHVEPNDGTRYEVLVAFGAGVISLSSFHPNESSATFPMIELDNDISKLPKCHKEYLAGKLCPNDLYTGMIYLYILWTIVNEDHENCLNNIREYLLTFRELYD